MKLSIRVERRNPSKNSTVIQIEGSWLWVETVTLEFPADELTLKAMIAMAAVSDERLTLTPEQIGV